MITSEEIIAWMRDYAERQLASGETTEEKFIFLLTAWIKDDDLRKSFNESDRANHKRVVMGMLDALKDKIREA